MSLVEVEENKFTGLWEGTVDNNASSVVNAIFVSDDIQPEVDFMTIADAVYLVDSPSSQILPGVDYVGSAQQKLLFYGLAVAGDDSGIYPETGDVGIFETDSPTIIAMDRQTVKVCTQGRCIARVGTQSGLGGAIAVGDPLTPADSGGELIIADASGDNIVARALQDAPEVGADLSIYIAVDIHREGLLP